MSSILFRQLPLNMKTFLAAYSSLGLVVALLSLWINSTVENASQLISINNLFYALVFLSSSLIYFIAIYVMKYKLKS